MAFYRTIVQTDSKYSDKELALLLKDRDNHAFSWLYDHYSGALYGFILQMLSNTEMASDVLQKVFVGAWRNIQQYDAGKESLFTWMVNMAHSLSVEVVRSVRSNSSSAPANQSSKESIGNTVHSLNPIGFASIFHKLNPEDRAIFDLVYFKGYNAEEIAAMKSISTGKVQERIQNVLLRLRELLK